MKVIICCNSGRLYNRLVPFYEGELFFAHRIYCEYRHCHYLEENSSADYKDLYLDNGIYAIEWTNEMLLEENEDYLEWLNIEMCYLTFSWIYTSDECIYQNNLFDDIKTKPEDLAKYIKLGGVGYVLDIRNLKRHDADYILVLRNKKGKRIERNYTQIVYHVQKKDEEILYLNVSFDEFRELLGKKRNLVVRKRLPKEVLERYEL